MQLTLADYGKTLATRQLASRLRGDLLPNSGDTLVLDFAGVLAVSHSFADELVGQLAETAVEGDGSFEVHVLNASDEVLLVVERACERRGAPQALKIPHAA